MRGGFTDFRPGQDETEAGREAGFAHPQLTQTNACMLCPQPEEEASKFQTWLKIWWDIPRLGERTTC
jgi:hypothetical protein